jgi:hypothetical protein
MSEQDNGQSSIAIDRAGIVKQLDQDRALARKNKSPAAAVSASMGKAKVLGLIREKHEHSGPNGGAIKHDLSGLSDKDLAALESILTKRELA